MTTHMPRKAEQTSPLMNDFWGQIGKLQRHPAYRTGYQTDPVRGLLAAVVLQAVSDVNPHRNIKAYYRETARQFLTEAEGEWLRYVGIPSSKILPFLQSLDRA